MALSGLLGCGCVRSRRGELQRKCLAPRVRSSAGGRLSQRGSGNGSARSWDPCALGSRRLSRPLTCPRKPPVPLAPPKAAHAHGLPTHVSVVLQPRSGGRPDSRSPLQRPRRRRHSAHTWCRRAQDSASRTGAKVNPSQQTPPLCGHLHFWQLLSAIQWPSYDNKYDCRTPFCVR